MLDFTSISGGFRFKLVFIKPERRRKMKECENYLHPNVVRKADPRIYHPS